jgi:hypothetical protein
MMASMPSFFRVGNDLVGNIADDFLTVLHCLVLKRVAAVGGAEDGAAAGQDAARTFERKFNRALGPDQPIEAVGDADDFPVIFENGRIADSADDGVKPGRVAAPGPDANATYVRHITRLMGARGNSDNVGCHNGVFTVAGRRRFPLALSS